MPREIERKFLVTNNAWRDSATAGTRYQQAYLASNPGCSIRVRITGDRAWLNLKSATLGVSRSEFEYEIPAADGREILERLSDGAVVVKTRYRVRHGEHDWEIDVFEGDNTGLIVAEIELASEDEPFDKPPWAGAEVSHDPRYYNVRLAQHPYRRW
jgi:adenylate cyclase